MQYIVHVYLSTLPTQHLQCIPVALLHLMHYGLYRGKKHRRFMICRNNTHDAGVVKSVLISTILTKYCPKNKTGKCYQHSQLGTQTYKHDTNRNLPHQKLSSLK